MQYFPTPCISCSAQLGLCNRLLLQQKEPTEIIVTCFVQLFMSSSYCQSGYRFLYEEEGFIWTIRTQVVKCLMRRFVLEKIISFCFSLIFICIIIVLLSLTSTNPGCISDKIFHKFPPSGPIFLHIMTLQKKNKTISFLILFRLFQKVLIFKYFLAAKDNSIYVNKHIG